VSIPPLSTITIEHQGRRYTGQYRVLPTNECEVFHSRATKRATLSLSHAEGLAKQLLFEIVARDNRGVPDPLDAPAG